MGAITTLVSECFENLIGLRETCTAQSPTSGLYLNQVGINMDFVKAIIMKDYASPESLVDDKIALATRLVVDQASQRFAEHIRTDSLIPGARAGQFKDNKVVKSGTANTLRGINLELCNKDSYLDVFVSEISMFTDFTGNIPILVYDLIQGKLIDTLTLSATAGEISTLYVNKIYKSNKKRLDIILVYDTTGINAYDTVLSSNCCSSCGTQCSTISNKYVTARSLEILSADDKIRSNIDLINHTGGMSIIYSVQCNKTDWMCENSNVFATPILYKAAAEIYEYALLSDRENSTTLISKEVMEERGKLSESKYQDSIDAVLKRIVLPKSDRCFSCNRQTINAIILP